MAFYPTHTAYVTLHTHIYRLYILVSRIYKQDFNTNRSWPDISRHRVLPIIEPGNCLHLFCIFRLPVAELRYIAQQCCINIFLRSISIKSVDKLNILKKYNEKWGGGQCSPLWVMHAQLIWPFCTYSANSAQLTLICCQLFLF